MPRIVLLLIFCLFTMTSQAVLAAGRTLRLSEALDLALTKGPAAVVMRNRQVAFRSDARQAGRRPNPGFSFESENFAGSGQANAFDTAELTFFLSQRLELFGKRSKRVKRAQLETDLAGWDLKQVQWRIIETTHELFVDLLEAQEAYAVQQGLLTISERTRTAVQGLIKAGAVLQVESYRTDVVIAEASAALARREANIALAKAKLVSLWGGDPDEIDRADGDLFESEENLTLDSYRKLLSNNPQLARWNTERRHRQARIAEERTLGKPDLEIGAGVRQFQESNDVGFVFESSLALPIFDRNQDAVAAARSRLLMMEAERKSVLYELTGDLKTTLGVIRATTAELQAIDNGMLPGAERAFESAREAYLLGRFSLTDVLDTQRTLFELRARRVQVAGERHRAWAELNGLIAQAPHNLNLQFGEE